MPLKEHKLVVVVPFDHPDIKLVHSFVCMFAFPSGSGICFPIIKTCVFGSDAKTGLLDDVPVAIRNEGDSGSSVKQVIKLIFCAAGLQVGILPENTFTEYIKPVC